MGFSRSSCAPIWVPCIVHLMGGEECITSPLFSVGVNGKPYGFFRVTRVRIERFVATLGFADDLLFFCKADMDSIRVFKRGLDRFAELSELRLNVLKSHLILSRAAHGMRDKLLAALGLQKGHLLMPYLGLPLISSILSIADCQPLLAKIDSCINDVLREIEKRLRSFLWKGATRWGYAYLAWRDVRKQAAEGKQGLRDIAILNRALMNKKLCDVIHCDRTSIWVE
ncbi:UNVERIFIED_CONTAM: hypothetical protein Sindi_0963400 [Sesamum indicum]